MCVLGEENGGSLLIYEGTTARDSKLVVKARGRMEKEVKEEKPKDSASVHTVAVTCYDLTAEQAQLLAKMAYKTMATTGLGLAVAIKKQIIKDLPFAANTLQLASRFCLLRTGLCKAV